VIEDADRLTESAANALLKVIEEPGVRTVWLLCAPTLTDVIPTIRSRCRHLTLRTPSIKAVTQLLIERDGIDPKMAEFAANAAQGHIGRAKYLATNEEARKTRERILSIPFTVKDLASAFEAANILVELAKSQALAESEARDELELAKLKESYGTTGRGLATGGKQAIKELEKEHKMRNSRLMKDFLDQGTLDIQYLYINKMNESKSDAISRTLILKNVKDIEETRLKIKYNTNAIILLENLFCKILLKDV
jgi:DNA polymerase-3 subunit delta'